MNNTDEDRFAANISDLEDHMSYIRTTFEDEEYDNCLAEAEAMLGSLTEFVAKMQETSASFND